jgi:transcriptional regulator with XRE-family HTH domain
MIIGERLRALRAEKNFSQGEVEQRTGLHCCYISRVENGRTVPAVETLVKFAHALDVPMYKLFYDGVRPPELPNIPANRTRNDIVWGRKGKDARLLAKFRQLFSNMRQGDLLLILCLAQKLARRKR